MLPKEKLEIDVQTLRQAIHEALTYLEADGKIYDKANANLIAAYIELEEAFKKTGRSSSVLMGVDRERRREEIAKSIAEAEANDLYEISEHISGKFIG